MINIVLDTNAIYNNWYLSNPDMLLIEKLITMGYCKLYLPEIVMLELKNCFKEEAQEYINGFAKYNARFKLHTITIPNLGQMYADFEKIIDKRIRELKIEIISADDIKQSEIISRSIEGRKPFRKSDKGYKDTLIWETIVNKIADTENTTVFITNNISDFENKSPEGRLHPDLENDLIKRGLPVTSVCLCRNINNFIEKYAGNFLRATELLKDGKYDSFSINDWFINSRDLIIAECDKQIEGHLERKPELEDPHVSYIEDPKDIHVKEIYALDENTVYIDVSVFSDVSVNVLVYKPDYYAIEDKYNFFLPDENYTEDYVFASLLLEDLSIDFSLTFNIETKVVEDFEINGFGSEEMFGRCKHCGAAIYNDAAEVCIKCGKDLF